MVQRISTESQPGQHLNGLVVQHHRRSTELVNALDLTRDWFEQHSWTPLPFQ